MTQPTQFDRVLFGYRFVETHFGDTLQTIAARELGDAARWTDLIAYNKLVPPFITDTAALAGNGVILTGQQILVPAPTPMVNSTTDPEKVFETDIMLTRGQLATDGDDFVTVSGRANLKQALKNRVDTELGELIYHAKTYGSGIRRLIGATNGPTQALLAARAAKAAVLQDPRISRVSSATAEVVGDAINVTVVGRAVDSRPVQFTFTV